MPAPLVELRGIVKTFPGVVANAGIDLTIAAGEVLALLGENGAGKSTLMSILAGLYRPDAGSIFFEGQRVEWRSPSDAIARGIGVLYQQFRLVDRFTVAENILLGWHEPRVFLNRRTGVARIETLARDHGLAVDPLARIWQLSLGERQRVEILKMLYRNTRVLVLDEPTSVLTPQEVDHLFFALRRMTAEGRAVVFISHKLDEVLAIAGRIVVLRAGRVAGEVAPRNTNHHELARLMVGRDVDIRDRGSPAPGPVVLELQHLSALGDGGRRALNDASLRISSGEILGIAGVAGNGQRELTEVIAGLRAATEGRLWLEGMEITRLSPRERSMRGIAYIPEDRSGEGLVGSFSVVENAALREYHRPALRRGPFLNWPAARAKAGTIVNTFQVRARDLDVAVRHLSGGNQQRLLVGREVLARSPRRGDRGSGTRPAVLIASYPTRGLDVEATGAVHRVLFDLRAAGTAIVLVSESLDELFAVADRIAIMHRGRIVGERPTIGATREDIGMMMAGAAVARPLA
jgi:simple sugar transport system ATP-binding protein